jgi:secretion/DNA translocation related CpaE-like protein
MSSMKDRVETSIVGQSRPEVEVVSREASLIGRATDVAAAAGCAVLRADDLAGVHPTRAVACLLGLDAADQLARSGLARRSSTVLIGVDGQERLLWQVAGEAGAAGAVCLPSGSAWLVRWLHGRMHGDPDRRCVVAPVVSAAGGVGASTLAAALAVGAAAAGLSPLLVDAHPGPAGVDLLLGDVHVAAHWDRFAGIRGFLDPKALQTLPVLEGVRCLGWAGSSAHPLWQGALGSVVSAAARSHDLVVVDAGLHPDGLLELPRASRPVLLVPASWRGALAAQPRLAALREAFDAPPLVVVRDIGGKGDPRSWLRHYEGSQVLLADFDPGVIDDEEQCRPPGTRPRSALGRLARELLAALARQPAAA